MHPDQLDIDEEIARRLIVGRFPELEQMPVRHVPGAGTVNTIFRVGDGLAARFPLTATSDAEVQREATALSEFAMHSPFPAPRPIGTGVADGDYPSAWSMQTWLSGATASPSGHATSEALADDLVSLILALRVADIAGRVFDGVGRGGDLHDSDERMKQCFERSTHLLDVGRAAALWNALRDVPRPGTDVMSHRDLTPENLLVASTSGSARLAGVLDSGGFGPADPALDLVCAWHLFDQPMREHLRRGVGADSVEWSRSAAWALQQSMGLVWY